MVLLGSVLFKNAYMAKVQELYICWIISFMFSILERCDHFSKDLTSRMVPSEFTSVTEKFV